MIENKITISIVSIFKTKIIVFFKKKTYTKTVPGKLIFAVFTVKKFDSCPYRLKTQSAHIIYCLIYS